MPDRPVVTGAAGHVGANLVRALLERGSSPRAVVRSDRRALEGLGVETVRADMLDLPALVRAFEGADVVYHLAAKISIVGDPDGSVRRTNVEGPRTVAAACREAGVRRLVHVSSVHAFEPPSDSSPITEAQPARTHGAPYDRSKADGERAILAAVADGLDAVIVNPTGILGPNDHKPSRMGRFLLTLWRHRMPALVTGGFDWVDARDVADGAILAGQKGRTGERYLLSGTYMPVAELAGLAREVAGQRPKRLVAPMWLARIGGPFGTLYGRLPGRSPLFTTESLVALTYPAVRSDKARGELGYDPRPLRATIEDTFAWFRAAGVLA